jgi:VIT1/CCC1 family predicted Fe2+/Mn2+ transporter
MFCNEVSEGNKVKAGSLTATVNAVEHIEVEAQAAAVEESEDAAETKAADQNNTTKHTIISLSRAIAADAETIGIPAAVTFYDRLGITEAEVEEMKGELA